MSQKPEAIAKQIEQGGKSGSKPPIDKWHPELSGDIDIVVSRDGKWLYQGRPIPREAIVRLFSTILRREEDGHFYLVTPVEKWRIQVEDTPLLAHTLEVSGEGRDQMLSVTTNVGETLPVDETHPLVVSTYPETGEPRPVIKMPHGLEARLVTAAYYELADLVVPARDGDDSLGVWSHGNFYKIGENG